jgi:hypothetical protein
VKAKANLPVIRINGIVSDRPFLPIILYSAMKLSTLVQGSGKVPEEEVKQQVFDHTLSKPSKMPPANTTVSIAKQTLNKDNLSRIASVILTANNINSILVKSFERKYKEREISYAAVKRLKASKGSLGNPMIATQKDPTSYMLQGVKQGWTDVIDACPVTMQSFDLGHNNVTVASGGGGGAQLHTTTTKSYNTETLECLLCTGSRENHYILDNLKTMELPSCWVISTCLL